MFSTLLLSRVVVRHEPVFWLLTVLPAARALQEANLIVKNSIAYNGMYNAVTKQAIAVLRAGKDVLRNVSARARLNCLGCGCASSVNR